MVIACETAQSPDAERDIQRRLDKIRNQSSKIRALATGTSVAELANIWLAVRSRGSADASSAGEGRRRGTARVLSPATLGAYGSAIEHVIIPTFGQLRLSEVTTPLLDEAFAELDEVRSTAQARTVMAQMMGFAVRRGLLTSNPMRDVEPSARLGSEVQFLEVPLVRHLRATLRNRTEVPRVQDGKRLGGRPPNRDLADVVDFALGTGARIGECLAIRVIDVDLASEPPVVYFCGTLVEPRRGYVEKLHRQPETKSRKDRTVPLPDAVVGIIRRRLAGRLPERDEPVFMSTKGTWLWPANIRTRLRTATMNDPLLRGTTPHTLRRSVGTLVAHECGLDAARDLLGHSDPSVTFRHYTGRRKIAPDVRHVLDEFFA